jgi:putative tryptophan/tyrosine transport system substrate-binding protein
MRRREFIALIGGAPAWPFAARAQQRERLRRIGVLMTSREDDANAQARLARFRQGLSELGWTEGRNIKVDYRWLGGDAAQAKANAAELVSQKPDVIVANNTPSLTAVRNETSTIPIVFVVVGDPVGQGFVSSLAHPGGNITGFTGIDFATGAKWLELIKEIVPQVRIGRMASAGIAMGHSGGGPGSVSAVYHFGDRPTPRTVAAFATGDQESTTEHEVVRLAQLR